MGFMDPPPVVRRSRSSRGKGHRPAHLHQTTNRQVKEGTEGRSSVENFKGNFLSDAKTETTTDSKNYPSSRSSIPTSCHDAPTQYIPQPQHHYNAPNMRAPDWRTYPPEAVPRFDLGNSTTLPEEKFIDIERLTNEHITHSIALREWMRQKSRKFNPVNSGMERHHERITDEVSAVDALDDAEKRHEAIREIEETYAAFVDIDTIGAHVSSRRQASEALQRQRRLPLSETKRLLGSDGSSSCYSGPLKEKHVYLVGSPPKVVRLPFDQAVDAGLEDIHAPGGYAFPSSSPLPDALQPQNPPFLFDPSANRRRTTTTLHIPEWFDYFALPLKGRSREAKWNDLTNRIYTLETKIRHSTDHEVVGRSNRSAAAAKKRTAKAQLAELQGAIDEAMAVVGERDKAAALEMLRGGKTARNGR
ncbi:hypothetical protein F4811DRAFT_230464 [Daldinia bambusicola]|nr:hypothetical protein F4811DRAFT_230464 [Daldinia bambusicola]